MRNHALHRRPSRQALADGGETKAQGYAAAVTVVGVLLAVAGLAAFVLAWRAAKVDPAIVLRGD